MKRMLIAGYLIGWVLSMAGAAVAGPGEEAAAAFAAGKALLAKADFYGALERFKTAAREDADNQEYAQQYAMLRQVIRMRGDSSKERDPERWLQMAGALRTYYHDHHLYSEALPLDEECHRRRRSAESAAGLAETQLALGMHSEAIDLLTGLSEEQTSQQTTVLHALALARTGQIDAAKVVVQKVEVKDEADPRVMYELACTRALIGDSEQALEVLTKSFELTPPSLLDSLKAQAKERADLGTIVSSAGFAEAMKTQSKVTESKCSKGPGCGNCPKRAKCGHGKQ